MSQYLQKENLIIELQGYDFSVDDLISADSYNEELLLAKFKKFPKEIQLLLFKCAVHVAIIGAGNKSYGMIRDGENVLQIQEILNAHKIHYNRNLNEKYEKDTLSIRRLIRLLRYQIQNFIAKNNRASYLWFKYSDRNEKMMDICFPGGEHLVENETQAKYLLNVYANIDSLLKTKFVQRLERVFIARRIMNPQEFIKK